MKDKCELCGRVLNPTKVVLLELCFKDGNYYYHFPDNHMPEEVSQGNFPFGPACAGRKGKFWNDEN